MLNHKEIAHYLLHRKLLSARQIVHAGLRVEDASARHSNHRVISEQGPSYLVKQAAGPGRIATLEREAAIYSLFRSGGTDEFYRYLPRFLDYDQDRHILIVELLTGAETMWARHRRLGRFSAGLATRLGNALGLLHSSYGAVRLKRAGVSELAAQPLAVLSVHRPLLRYYEEISGANLQLIRMVQKFDSFGTLLDELRAQWHQECLVHGDIKWNNLLVTRSTQNGGRAPALKLIDWELAGSGDPCWDVGSIFGEYMAFWLLSIPITGGDPPDYYLQLAFSPIEKMQPAMRAFWQAYIDKMGLVGSERDAFLLRAVRYAGARLLQTAYERSQTASRLTGDAICLLQLSLNIMQRPTEAALHLLGIPFEGGTSA